MCLYTKMVKNPKYLPNKQNKGIAPICDDERKKYVPVKCGNCIECRKQKQREWQIRLSNEIKHDKTGKFVTLTFSEEALNKLQGNNLMEANELAKKAVRFFLERWRKKYGKSIKHWLITELGHNGTERIHLHGILFTDKTNEEIEERWGYGWVFVGHTMNMRTINYIIKYITKQDIDHKEFNGRILTTPGIGKKFLESSDAKINKYKKEGTINYLKLPNGVKTSIPTYYRNKLYSDEEREAMWIESLEKDEAYVLGQKIKNISSEEGEKELWNAIKYARKRSKEAGFGTGNQKKKKFMTKKGKIIWK